MNNQLEIPDSIDLQGHRGCRSLMPENTIPSFIKALDLRVTTLEMDVVITKDKQVVVSHDPFLSHEICLKSDGREIWANEEKKYNIYQMYSSELVKYDCGTKPHPRFPEQQKLKLHKPLLEEVIDSAENYAAQKKLPSPLYNIEIKSVAETDNVFHPAPEEFSELLLEVLKKKNILNRTTVQCFDVRVLQYLHAKYAHVTLAYLVENMDSPEKNLELLGFIPAIYSPEYLLVDEHLIQLAHNKKMKVLPWTVNTIEEAQKLIGLGVDGIITDYPSLFKKK